MPARRPLTANEVKNAKAEGKERRLYDTNGLYLTVTPGGRKWWRLKYTFEGRERRMGLGAYPEVSLQVARSLRDDARGMLRKGKDPQLESRRARSLTGDPTWNTFEAVATQFISSRSPKWTASYRLKLQRSLERDIFPYLGRMPIAQIQRKDLLDCLKRIETERAAVDMARRVCQRCSMVFQFAINSGICDHNIARELPSVLTQRTVQHHKFLRSTDLPEFVVAMDSYQGEPLTKLAMRLLLLTFVRTKELREARWHEINLSSARWDIPAARMKMRQPHVVPLSRQAIKVLEAVHELNVDGSDYVFPQSFNAQKPMSENTILYALYRMGYRGRTTGHGFRSTASTLLNEARFPVDAIEMQLSHSDKNKVRAAYNYANWLPEREQMMQAWADFLDGLKDLPRASQRLRVAARALD
ncbi:tyrosine-type recombinase/integrase [Luteibacter sp. PPL554]